MKVQKTSDKIVFREDTFTKRVLFSEDKVLCFLLNLMPGQSIPPHNHEESDLLLHVLSGSFDLTVDDKTTGLNVGDVVHCTGKEVFSMNNVKENTTCLVVLAPSPEMKAYSQEIGVQEIGFQTGERYKNIQQ